MKRLPHVSCGGKWESLSNLQSENNNNKPKNVVGVEGGRNRRVLQDIGNLVINQADPAANANVPKRITRWMTVANIYLHTYILKTKEDMSKRL
ncbi:hypothetical protein QL285_094285 [Trifolium repens]|nr:hypothetical protein QL285_094285 [Trifolium repens]